MASVDVVLEGPITDPALSEKLTALSRWNPGVWTPQPLR